MFRTRNNNKHTVGDETLLLVKFIKEKKWDNVMATLRELDEHDDDTVLLTELTATVVQHDNYRSKKQDRDGLPLHFACRHGAPLYVLQKLLHYAPDAISSCANKAGRLPLHEFCKSPQVQNDSDSEETVKFLQGQYADSLTIADKDGNLVLHLACRNGLRRVVPFLCQENPDSVIIPNNKGSIPVHCAKTADIVQYFHNQYPMTAKVKLSNETFDDDDPNQSKLMKNFLKYMPKASGW